MLKSSAQFDIENFLDGKSEEVKTAFYYGLQYGADLTKAFLDVYFKADEIHKDEC